MLYALGLYPYFVSLFIIFMGLLIVILKPHLLKKMVGLMIFQSGVIIFYMAVSKVTGGSAPIIAPNIFVYSNPLPHVLMLTAIVVGIATVAVACALIVDIYRSYGTLSYPDLSTVLSEDYHV